MCIRDRNGIGARTKEPGQSRCLGRQFITGRFGFFGQQRQHLITNRQQLGKRQELQEI